MLSCLEKNEQLFVQIHLYKSTSFQHVLHLHICIILFEQLDTPANIVLNPATEYVRKFTEEVPREKVLVIEDVMDSSNKDNLGDLKVSKDDIIENVAEKILTQENIVGVVDKNNNVVGSIKPSKIIDTVFGGRKNGS